MGPTAVPIVLAVAGLVLVALGGPTPAVDQQLPRWAAAGAGGGFLLVAAALGLARTRLWLARNLVPAALCLNLSMPIIYLVEEFKVFVGVVGVATGAVVAAALAAMLDPSWRAQMRSGMGKSDR